MAEQDQGLGTIRRRPCSVRESFRARQNSSDPSRARIRAVIGFLGRIERYNKDDPIFCLSRMCCQEESSIGRPFQRTDRRLQRPSPNDLKCRAGPHNHRASIICGHRGQKRRARRKGNAAPRRVPIGGCEVHIISIARISADEAGESIVKRWRADGQSNDLGFIKARRCWLTTHNSLLGRKGCRVERSA